MKRLRMLLANICYVAGVFASVYVGGWLMLIVPVGELFSALREGELTVTMLGADIIKIALSTTFAGLVWTIGYIGYNHFRGTEDPKWDQENSANSGQGR